MRRIRRTIKSIVKIIHEIVIRTISWFGSVSLINAISLNKVTVYWATKQWNWLPEWYTELWCIQNVASSTRYNTGIIPAQWDILEVKFRANRGSLYLLESRIWSGWNLYGLWWWSTDNRISGYVNDYLTTLETINRNTTWDVIYLRFSFSGGTTELYARNETKGTEETVTGTYTWASTARAYRLWSNSAQTYAYTSWVFFARITNWNTWQLRMNWIPAEYNGTISFYDTVTETFVTKESWSSPTLLYNTPSPQVPQDIITNCWALKVNSNWLYGDNPEIIEDENDNEATAQILMNLSWKQDTQELLSGNIHRNVCTLVLTWDEEFVSAKTWETYRYRLPLTDLPFQDGVNSRWSIISTHFKTIHTATVQTVWWAFTYSSQIGSNLYVIPAQTLDTTPKFKERLTEQYNDGTPVILAYPLAEEKIQTVGWQNLKVSRTWADTIQITQAWIDPNELAIEVEYDAIVTN